MRWLSAWFSCRPIHFVFPVTAFILSLLPVLSGSTASAQFLQLNTARQSVIFPTTLVGSTSAAVTVPLLVHQESLTISAIAVQPSAGGQQEYTVRSIGCALNTVLPAGTICNVSVTFTPAGSGGRPDPLKVQTSSGNFNFGMEGVGIGPQVALNPAVINTVAGNGSSTFSDGGPAISAGVPVPIGIAVDSAGNLYITDVVDDAIRIVAANSGIITSVAGWAQATTVIKPMHVVVSAVPTGMAVDSAGNIYIDDSGNNVIREISAATGKISTVVYINGARLNGPQGVAFDNADDLYIADSGNNVIRRVDAATGIITTVAGNLKPGYSGDGGAATDAELNNPIGVVVDSAGNIFIADLENHVIRKVAAATGIITTVAGTGTPGFSGDGGPAISAELHSPSDVAVDSAGDLYIADTNNSRIREVSATSGVITTVVGTGTAGFAGDNSSATNAELNYPNYVILDSSGNLYIADSLNNRIRKINVLDSRLNFATTPIGFSSLDSPQTATVTNIGNAPLVFSIPSSGLNPSVSPNFGLSTSSTCPQLDISSSTKSLAPGSSCNLLLSFTPIQTGTISGTANIADNAAGTPPFVQTVHLNAIGLPASAGRPDFSLAATPSSQTISSTSAPAVYTVTVTGIYGFTGDVALVASGLPTGVTASFAPASVTISGAKTSSAFTIAIPKMKAESMPGDSHFPGKGSAIEYGLLLLGFPLFGMARRRKGMGSVRGKFLFTILALAGLGVAATGMIGCANIGLVLKPQNYTITINGTNGNLQRSTTLSLTVETYTKVKFH